MTSRSSTTARRRTKRNAGARRTAADVAPTHPGEVLLKDYLEPLGMSRSALAKAIGVAQIRVGQIVQGRRAVTPDTALRLARYFNTSAQFWLGMEQTYVLETSRDWIGEAIEARIVPRGA